MTRAAAPPDSGSAVVIFAKAPRPGLVKTRMCPPLAEEEAAALYEAMLADVVAATAALCAARGHRLSVTVHPADARAELAALVPAGVCVVGQRGADLGARMAWAIGEAAAAGHQRIALRGSDSPALDPAELDRALDALAEADVALSPDVDGGYNVLAVRRPFPGLLEHAMSTASVADDTLASARALGLRAVELAPSFDVDRIDDLGRLAEARRGAPDGFASRCPRTLEMLDRRRWWPGPAR